MLMGDYISVNVYLYIYILLLLLYFFFFKQKTAYEIGTGDWSSDVCSSDLNILLEHFAESTGTGLTNSQGLKIEIPIFFLQIIM